MSASLPSLVLVGYRASGKSTVGPILAERLQMGFVDSDQQIVGRAGKTIREIFADGGEERFRELETAVIGEIAGLSNHVIALGGGALGRAENRAAIQAAGHKIIYLRCDPRELLKRIQADPATASARPALSKLGGGIDEIEQLLLQREPIWQSVAHVELDVTNLSPREVVAALARRV